MTKADVYAHLTDMLRDEAPASGGVVRVGALVGRLRKLADRLGDDLRAEKGMRPIYEVSPANFMGSGQ